MVIGTRIRVRTAKKKRDLLHCSRSMVYDLMK